MKTITVFFCCACLLSSAAFASEAKKDNKKIYLPLNSLKISEKSISLISSKGDIALSALYRDENGYFVYKHQLQQCGCPFLERKRREAEEKKKLEAENHKKPNHKTN